MSWFNDEKREKQILSGEQDILTAEQSELGLLRQILAGQAALAITSARIEGKVNQIMSSTNDAAALIAQLGASEARIETDVAILATNQASALADLKAIIAGKSGNSLDEASKAALQAAVDKFAGVDTALQSLAQSAKDADPGAPIVVTTSGTPSA